MCNGSNIFWSDTEMIQVWTNDSYESKNEIAHPLTFQRKVGRFPLETMVWIIPITFLSLTLRFSTLGEQATVFQGEVLASLLAYKKISGDKRTRIFQYAQTTKWLYIPLCPTGPPWKVFLSYF